MWLGDIDEAGGHEEGHRFNNPKRFADTNKSGFFHWVRKRLPTAGAQNYAFESLGLVERSFIGAGVSPALHLNKMQNQPSYVGVNSVVVNGLGGLVAGQLILQGLYDPNTGTYAGQPLGGAQNG